MAQLNGGTHMSLEDVGLMRNLPTMTIFEPVDGVQLAAIFPQIIEHNGPVYIRLLRQEFDAIFDDNQTFELGKATPIIEGLMFDFCIRYYGRSFRCTKILEKKASQQA
jgi:transketolase